MRAGGAVRADRHRRDPRRGHRLASRPVAEQRPRRDRPFGRRPRAGPLRVQPRLSRRRPEPGCDYERWARRVTADTQPTTYAHVAQEPAHPERLSLQYWLYPFNDWNNLHEGDWEMIQLVFAAGERGGGPGHGAARDRLQPARGRRAGGVGRRSSSSSTDAPGRLPRPARTRTSSPRASTWDARPSRGSAATTRPARMKRSGRRCFRSRATPRRRGQRSPGSRSRVAGASASRRSTTAPRGRT